MLRNAGLVLLATVALTFPAELLAQNATSSLAVSANTTGSLGNLCSSQAGILSLLQGATGNQSVANAASVASLNITIPANLSNSNATQQIAQIAWEYIYSYPLPVLAHTVASLSGNGTAVNTFYSKSNHLSVPADNSLTPNHDTIYSQAELDLSQGPQIVTVPTFDVPSRYWIVPFLDAYLNYYGAIGSDFNSTAGQYLVVGRKDTQNVIAALPPQQVIYFQASVDNQNLTLDASTGNNYTITFPLPLPAQAFWSLTLYNATSLNLIVNPINRYNINDRTSGLVYGGTNNSTLTVFISASQPALGTAEYANWLPAPNNSAMFFLLRTYEPPSYAIAGGYSPQALFALHQAVLRQLANRFAS